MYTLFNALHVQRSILLLACPQDRVYHLWLGSNVDLAHYQLSSHALNKLAVIDWLRRVVKIGDVAQVSAIDYRHLSVDQLVLNL